MDSAAAGTLVNEMIEQRFFERHTPEGRLYDLLKVLDPSTAEDVNHFIAILPGQQQYKILKAIDAVMQRIVALESATLELPIPLARFSAALTVEDEVDEEAGLRFGLNGERLFFASAAEFTVRPVFRNGLTIAYLDIPETPILDCFIEVERRVFYIGPEGELVVDVPTESVENLLTLKRDGVTHTEFKSTGALSINIKGLGDFPVMSLASNAFPFFSMDANGLVTQGSIDSGAVVVFTYDGSPVATIGNGGAYTDLP